MEKQDQKVMTKNEKIVMTEKQAELLSRSFMAMNQAKAKLDEVQAYHQSITELIVDSSLIDVKRVLSVKIGEDNRTLSVVVKNEEEVEAD